MQIPTPHASMTRRQAGRIAVLAALLGASTFLAGANDVSAQRARSASIMQSLQACDLKRPQDCAEVTVTGTITSDPGAGPSAARPFSIQDSSGAVAIVPPDATIIRSSLQRGDRVRVVGRIRASAGGAELVPKDVARVGTDSLPQPRDLLVGDLRDDRYAEQVVRVSGTLVLPTGFQPANPRLLVRDRSGEAAVLLPAAVFANAGLAARLRKGGEVTVVGIAARHRDGAAGSAPGAGLSVAPRDAADIRFGARSGMNSGTSASTSSATSASTSAASNSRTSGAPYREMAFLALGLYAVSLAIYFWSRRRSAEARARELTAMSDDLRRSEEALRESEERYMLAARGANDGLWDWDLRSGLVYFSTRWKSMLGYDEAAVGTEPDEWLGRVHPNDAQRVRAELDAHLAGRTPHFESEHRVLHGDGEYRWMLTRALVVRDESGRANRIAGSQTDITDRKIATQRILDNAVHDALTGLPNRALFTDIVFRAISRAQRQPNYRFAVLFLDFDRFKVINDSLGHMVGDQLLVAIARRLECCIRTSDSLSRLGGDEFTVFVDDLKDVSDATHLADRILKEMAVSFTLSGHEVFTSVSIGIAISTSGYSQPEEVLRDADLAMYRAKANGKGRYQVFDSAMHARAMLLMQMETDLRRAIEREEFVLHYQPIMSLSLGRIAGFEALIRWHHPERGLFSPDTFIPLAEETGLMLPIGQWVLREACRQARAWQLHSPAHADLSISVNVSARQFVQPTLVQEIRAILADTGLAPEHLKLEITESVLMDNAEAAILTLRQLRALGVQLHLDDFGTGYSSLSYLHRFPIDALKIDQSFVRKMGDDQECLEIVRTIMTLARNLRIGVIAEGVETSEQRAQLWALECEFLQGYLFSKPVEAAQAQGVLDRDRADLEARQLVPYGASRR
ncbi:MAG: EAL domain-containing protein [Gemmatimonadaceae bacterium]